jgi:hypothetical protein
MKISIDMQEASAVVYLPVVCRRNIVTDGCKLQAVDYLLNTYSSTLVQNFRNITYFGIMWTHAEYVITLTYLFDLLTQVCTLLQH